MKMKPALVALALALALAPATAAFAAPKLHTVDPELVKGDVFEVRGYLQIHASELGGRADERDPLVLGTRLGFLLFDDQDAITGAAIVTRSARALDVDVLPLRLTAATAIARVVGTRVTQSTTYGHGAGIDCGMSGRANGCAPKIVKTLRRTVVAGADEVSAAVDLRAVDKQPRLVVCVLVAPPTVDVPDLGVIATSVAGYPATYDASTGAALGLHPPYCL